jgi:hypothetical protein
MAHDHQHDHLQHHHHHHDVKPRVAIGRSLLLMGAGQRVVIAVCLTAMIWLMILGSIA